MTGASPDTLINALKASFAASLRAPDGVAPPAALLWTDADGHWKPLLPALMKALPELYVLGPYAPEERQGPVIWLKCVVERTLPDVSPAPDLTPILYLPNVSRQDLRAGGDFPPDKRHLMPLVELQYRGTVWHQRNGRDWTVEAFLTSEDALGLDVARDQRTRDAMLRALPLLAEEPLAALRGRRLEADDFDRLAIGDPIRDLLTWMSDAEAFEGRCDGGRWATFRDVCRREFGFDPDQDGAPAAAEALLNGGGRWDEAWRRFCDAPRLYPGVSTLLKGARPRDLLVDPSRRPGLNEEKEDNLRRELEAVRALPHAEACERVAALDDQHKERRGWVWAQIGESPYATALEPLAGLARHARATLGGTSVEAVATAYAEDGWRCDRAAIEALSCLKPGAESMLVAEVVRALYEPWLDRSARHFQELVSARGMDARILITGVPAERDTCVVFVDGLRFDIAATLEERLEAQGLRVSLSHRLTPVPTVTATAKPMATPVRARCEGSAATEDFTPAIVATGQAATAPRLRDEMGRLGVEVLEAGETRLATGGEHGAWAEIGKLDATGHSLGAALVRQIEAEVDAIVDRISGLLAAGWEQVRVVTDHGWLLLPGGLPKVEMPPSLVASKWARCATVKGESSTTMPTYPWHWNEHVRIASPPGIGSFVANIEYAHGGVSPQECVIPDLVVSRGAEAVHAKIRTITWRGMRCRVSVDTNSSEVEADIRFKLKQPVSSIAASTKRVGTDGEASLAVADDSHEGTAATVVLVDKSGQVLDYMTTTVGEER